MAKLKLSGAAVLLIIVVPLFMYTGALLIGVQLGRALERRPPDSVNVSFTIRGALAYLAKELWDANNNVLGRRRGDAKVAQVLELVPAKLVRDESSAALQPKHDHPTSDTAALPWVEAKDRSRATPPKPQRYHTNHTSPMRSVISVGPWGGSGGQPFYMRGPRAPHLRSIVVYHSTAIHSFSCDYTLSLAGDGDETSRIRTAGPWGRPNSFGSKGVRATINLSADEHVTAVEGTVGHFGRVSDVVVTSLTFRTSTGRTYGPYGSKAGETTTGTPFSVPAADGACIVGFWGRSGWLLDAIGVYVRPCLSSTPARYNHRPYAAAAVPSPPKIYAVPRKAKIVDDESRVNHC